MNGSDVTFVTLTIPGREQLLARCLKSVYDQTVRPFAHLVLAEGDHKDVGRMYNNLVMAVRTPFIHFLDDDNYLLPHHLETILPHLDDADIVYSYETSATRPRVDISDWSREELVRGFARENFVDNTCAIRTDVFRAVGGFDGNTQTPKDWILMQALAARGARFRCVPEETWHYTQFEYKGELMDAREIRKLGHEPSPHSENGRVVVRAR